MAFCASVTPIRQIIRWNLHLKSVGNQLMNLIASTSTMARDLVTPPHGSFRLPDTVFRDLNSEHGAEAAPRVADVVLHYLAQNTTPRGVAFVLPATGPLPVIIGLLHALSCAAHDFNARAGRANAMPFSRGDLVHLSPDGWVYEFDGILTYSGASFIRLKVPNDAGARVHTIVAEEVFRLHRVDTPGATPSAKQKPGPVPSPLLDRLIGVRTGGNLGTLPTRVLLLTARGAARAATESIAVLESADGSSSSTLADLLTWGRITEDGELTSEDRRSGGRPPIIATTHSVDYLAAAVRRGNAEGAVVVVDGVSAISNLQALDDVVARRRTAIITDYRNVEILPELAARGVHIWALQPDEMSEAKDVAQGPLFGQVARAARNAADLRIDGVTVENPDLESARHALGMAERAVRMNDSGEDVQHVIRKAYRLLMTAAEWFKPPDAERLARFDHDVADVGNSLQNLAIWIEPDVARHTRDALHCLSHAAHDPTIGYAKAAALTEVLGTERGSKAVLVRTAAACEGVRSILASEEAAVFPASERTGVAPVDLLVIGAWPSGRTLQRVVGSFATPRVTVIGYPFEQEWLGLFRKRWRTGIPDTIRSANQKRELTGITGWSDHPGTTAADESVIDGDDPVARFLVWSPGARKDGTAVSVSEADAREATYVGFVGSSYTYLTAGRSVPVVTDVVMRPDGDFARIPLRKLNDIGRGDFLLFRDHGDSDVITAVAEQIVGPDKYRRLRTDAESWRASLASLGSSPARVHESLMRFGLTRTFETVKGWLRDDDRIGPQARKDLAIMADAGGDEGLAAKLETVWAAICEVRALHRQAGHAVSALILQELPQKLKLIYDAENRVELTFGTGWVVCVEEIASQPEERPYWDVNRILWADEL